MSLEDLGNIGEFIAAIAVVLSLIYLAVQIRQNTRSVRMASHYAVMSEFRTNIRVLTQDPELASAYQAGLEHPDQLSDTDRARFGPLLKSLAAQAHYLTRLAVRDRERIRVLDANDVDWIGLKNQRVVVHVGEKTYPIHRTLTELASRLDPATFFRAHRSAIVNLNRVQEVIPWFKGSHKLRLTTGAEVDLSRAQARALRKIFGR